MAPSAANAIENSKLLLLFGKATAKLLSAPSGFTYIPPYNIYRVGTGSASTFTTNYNPVAKRPTPTASVYVGIGGNNNNNGLTYATRVRSFSLAILIANNSFPGQVVNLLYEGGQYLLTNSQARSGQPSLNGTYQDIWNIISVNAPLCDLVIEPNDGVSTAELIMNRAAPVWTSTSDGNVWKATALVATNLGAIIADTSNIDPDGQPTGLYNIFTVADPLNPYTELNAAWTTYGIGARYWDATNSVMWVRTFNNRQPDASIRIHDSGTFAGFSANAAATRTIWINGLSFRGGQVAYKSLANGASGFKVNTYTVNCAFTHAGGNAGGLGGFIHQNGGGEIIHLRSVSSYNVDDCFAYYDATQSPTFNEINCSSRFSGLSPSELSVNASTSHGSCTGVRVMGNYLNALDRSIHDINSAKTWNLGCTISNQRGPAGGDTSCCIAAGFAAQSAQVWIDAVNAVNGAQGAAQHPTEAYSGSTLNYANMNFTPTAAPGTGTVQAYVP
jgi:hypothetical protein